MIVTLSPILNLFCIYWMFSLFLAQFCVHLC